MAKFRRVARGRPPKLTPKLRESISLALRAGNYIEPSAILNGVSKVTLYSWLKRGVAERERLAKNKRAKPRKQEKPYLQFLNAVEKAQAAAEARDVALIETAAKKQWQAAAWRLERKYPKRWGRYQRHEHSGADGGPINFKGTVLTSEDLGRLTDDELSVLKKILKARSE